MTVAAYESLPEHLGQVGCLRGQHINAFVQVSIAGGDPDTGIAGQACDVRGLAEPAQHQHRVAEHAQRPPAAAGTACGQFDQQQPRQVLGKRADVERGTIGTHVEPLVGLDLRKSSPTKGSTPIRSRANRAAQRSTW